MNPHAGLKWVMSFETARKAPKSPRRRRSTDGPPRKPGRPPKDGSEPKTHAIATGVTHSVYRSEKYPFKAQLSVGGSTMHLGRYRTIPEAVEVVAAARRFKQEIDTQVHVRWRLQEAGFSIRGAARKGS